MRDLWRRRYKGQGHGSHQNKQEFYVMLQAGQPEVLAFKGKSGNDK
ncbi:MAG: hypothetical protein ACE5I7_19670 [Candidatus Binatia bacterium]